jgi:hypothetical protein
VATTGGIDSGDVRDLMTGSVERRFGLVNRLPVPIEWLSDKGLALISRARPARWPGRSAWRRAQRRSKARYRTESSKPS